MIRKQDFKRVNEYVWEIPVTYRDDMNVPARLYASERLLENALGDKSIEQLINTATLPGLVGYALAMPDIHQGYGFPIGGVIASRTKDGVISPGGVGYDINCGVRVLGSNLLFEEIEPHLSRLASKLYSNCPSGVGQGGSVRLKDHEFEDLLHEGGKWAVRAGYATQEDVQRTEARAQLPGADVEAVGDPMDALTSGHELAAQGKHAEASVFFSRGIELIADEGDPRTCAKLHAAQARAREHLGNLRAAEQHHTATLTAVERGGAAEPEGVDACSALLARGRCRMQLEDYVAACEDFTDALRSNPSSRAASEALRDAKRLADQQSSAREKEAKCAKDMPVLFAKPGLRQFEPRGKAGSAF